ncbi:MAG TPA: M36 family metallopeptidase [Kofleriaceae bacterium]|nr:M36 family metallopeptidase [Kofleriaceae bacterium]
MRSLLASLSPLSSIALGLALAACGDRGGGGGNSGSIARAATTTPGGADPSAPVRAVPMTQGGQRARLFAGGGERIDAPTAAALAYVARLAPAWGAPAGTADLTPIATVHGHLGDIVRVQQSVDGLPVHRRELRVLVRPDGSLGAASGVAIPRDVDRHGSFRLAAADAVSRAIGATHGLGADPSNLIAKAGGTADEVWFHSPDGATPYVSQARARRMWHDAGDHLEAAWIVEAYSAASPTGTDSQLFRTVVSADSGEVLAQTNLTDDAFHYRVWADTTGDLRPLDGPVADFTPLPGGAPGGPRPPYIPPSLVALDGLNHPDGAAAPDPWLPAGATETNGNHVDAYTDLNPPDGFNAPDFHASVTAPGSFDRVYDVARGPLATVDQQKAAITSLFYTMNWLHDDWYDAGFVEAAANGQLDNYGRGGVEGDPLLAEAQDNANGGARNNANMSTPEDGMSPRMQVYLWTGADHVDMTVMPTGRTPNVDGAAFDPRIYDITGALVAATDGTAPATDACQPLTNNVAGKIVLADRGMCSFKRKAVNIQAAGGVGAIIANNQATGLPNLGDDSSIDTAITIPVQGVSMDDGNQLRASLANGPVTIRLHRQSDPDNDGSLDAALVAHEYGHYIHHRLSECNTKLCGGMSEGWADFDALMMMARPGDDLNGTYAISTYAAAGDPYWGIRRAPYSVDFDKNAFTLKNIAAGEPVPTRAPTLDFGDNTEVHNTGEIWAEMLWEAYVGLQRAHDDFPSTRKLMQKYVVDGLMMAPVDATITETRDAILLAAFMNDPADHDALAAAFARRGAGSCAQSPARDSVDFTDLAESYELKPNSYATAPELTIDVHDCDGDGVLDVGETATVRTTIGNNGAAALQDVTVALTSTTPGLTVKTAPIVIPSIDHYASMPLSFEVSLDSGSEPVAGDLALEVTAAGACTPDLKVSRLVRMNVDDKPGASTTDTFDAQPGAWTTMGAGATDIWTEQRETALDGQWVGVDFGAPSQTALVSPALDAGSGDVTIEFDHAYDFELSDGTYWDGGVIEASTDGGTTWQDLGSTADMAYTGVITDQAGNPLAGRMAYGGQSAGFPGKQHVKLSLGTMFAHQTFQVRFLIGTDEAVGAGGWRIDDFKVSGITNKPFPSQVDDAGECNPDATPGGGDDGGCCQTGSSGGGAAAPAVLVLGALILRRRRRR